MNDFQHQFSFTFAPKFPSGQNNEDLFLLV
jgi:hypothetical protein